ncbi:hypothetical protein [Mycolicibacterium pulveris]|uniref:hypothetical protein n=1 Tax=Mycolicibacterium pulveris TaxID=36813 RepID=UPI003CEF2EE1
MRFTLPDQLPADSGGLVELADQATSEIRKFRSRGPQGLSDADLDRWEQLLDARDAAISARKALERESLRRGEVSKRLAAAAHEAGHAVALAWFGGEVNTAEVFQPVHGDPPVGRDGWRLHGQCRPAPLSTVTQARRDLITAAGPAAQAIALYGSSPSRAQIDRVLAGQQDREELRRYALTAAVTVPDLIGEAMPIVRSCWPAIAKLAVHMDDRGPITHDDVCAALGLSKDRALHAFELANIRAGMRTVPAPA